MGFWLAVLNLIIIDVVLSGDNAVVIALAIRHLPPALGRQAAMLGALGAVTLRLLFTLLAATLLTRPYVQAAGGAMLFWIAARMLKEEEESPEAKREIHALGGAVRTIVVADVIMSLDNILAIGGASHGNLWLLLFGLGLSIPLVLFASSFLADLMDRWRWLAYLGTGVLAWTAGRMVVEDVAVRPVLAPVGPLWLHWLLPATGVALTLAAGHWAATRLNRGA